MPGKIIHAWKALVQLGPRQVFWYAVYQAGLRSGAWRLLTPPKIQAAAPALQPIFALPDREKIRSLLGEAARADLTQEAEEIAQSIFRPFGGPPVPLELALPFPLRHWTSWETRPAAHGIEDVKFTWEPARFSWAFTLGRAYLLTGNERLAAAFWQHFENFDRANPPNRGPNWASGQEVGLRLLALLFSAQAFAPSSTSTPQRLARLACSALEHALRIPPTLSYARAQHNNHLVSEALGLYAAGRAFPDHPRAKRWREMGWHELNHAIQSQVSGEGVYSQHSTNYHRLFLEAALLADCFARAEGRTWPQLTRLRLGVAARWLAAQLDATSGRVPNLGSNDGAALLPLAGGGFFDYRPTIQAAACAFLGSALLPRGPWDELCAWLAIPWPEEKTLPLTVSSPAVHRIGGPLTWASIRAAQFTSRPAHADQLHVEFWHAGENLALDPGTYRYNAAPPWNNSLASTFVHNTVLVDGLDQMTRAGKFLWVDWAQARVLSAASDQITCEHNGYLRLGILHRRTLRRMDGRNWQIEDQLLPALAGETRTREHTYTLHWLAPDRPYEPGDHYLILNGGPFPWRISIESRPAQGQIQLIRAGEALVGPASPSPLLGWHSPTYSVRLPALSILLTLRCAPPLTFLTTFSL